MQQQVTNMGTTDFIDILDLQYLADGGEKLQSNKMSVLQGCFDRCK